MTQDGTVDGSKFDKESAVLSGKSLQMQLDRYQIVVRCDFLIATIWASSSMRSVQATCLVFMLFFAQPPNFFSSSGKHFSGFKFSIFCYMSK